MSPADAETMTENRPDAAPTGRKTLTGRTLVLLNPGSGKDDATSDRKTLLQTIEVSPDSDIRTLEPDTDISAAARQGVEDAYGTIVAAGGDGTISGVSAALAGTGVTLGILPFGTFNFFARSLGIPDDPQAAWQVIQSGQTRPVSIGEINGCHFINNASIGAYATVLQMREDVYRRWGRSRLTAYWSVIKAMSTLYRPLRMEITVDGEKQDVRAPMAFAAVRPYQLEEYGLSGADAIRDGKLALYLPPDAGRAMLLWRAIKVLAQRVEKGQDYTMFTGREITIDTFRGDRLVAWDGERSRMSNPFHLRMLPDALQVRVPTDGDDSR